MGERRAVKEVGKTGKTARCRRRGLSSNAKISIPLDRVRRLLKEMRIREETVEKNGPILFLDFGYLADKVKNKDLTP